MELTIEMVTDELVKPFIGGTFDMISLETQSFRWIRGTITEGPSRITTPFQEPAISTMSDNNVGLSQRVGMPPVQDDDIWKIPLCIYLERGPIERDDEGRLILHDCLFGHVIVLTAWDCEPPASWKTRDVGIAPGGAGGAAFYDVVATYEPDANGNHLTVTVVQNET